jgi:hypothetical protein
MTIRATQPISSAFGTYMPGQEISEAAAGPVLNAWLAAGIAAEETDVAETPQPAAPVERATAPKRETTAGRRQAEAPQRRFQTDADVAKAPHRRFVENTEAER